MWSHPLLDTLLARSGRIRSRKGRLAPSFPRRCRSFRPLLEILEARTLLSAPVSTTDGLVAAINTANSSGGAATITLASGATFDFTSANNSTKGANALPVITGNITIAGSGATIERTGSTTFRLFDVSSGGSLTLQDLTLQGGEASGAGTAADGGAIYSSGTLNLSAVLVQGNKAVGAAGTGFSARPGADALGGGLYVAGGSVSLINDTLSGNSAQGGTGGRGDAGHIAGFPGGVGGVGGNGNGGGLGVEDATSVNLINDTLSGNSAQGGAGGTGGSGDSGGIGPGGNGGNGGAGGNGTGGGLYLLTNSNVILTNTLMAQNNVAPGTGGTGGPGGKGGLGQSNGAAGASGSAGSVLSPDVNGSVNSSDHDLIGDPSGSTGFSTPLDLLGTAANPLNPQLGPLQNNGGPTQTMDLLPGSPAINAGDNNFQSITGQFDQRGPGFARVVGGTIDIGAFEVQPPPPTQSPPPPSSDSPPRPALPPTLHTPPLLAFFDSLLGAVETVNGNDTETVTDSLFGFPLMVSIYDGNGDLMSVTIFGIDITFLFRSTP